MADLTTAEMDAMRPAFLEAMAKRTAPTEAPRPAPEAPRPAAPFHERSEFAEVYARLRFVSLGIAAMKGIGGMMRTGMDQMEAGGHEAAYVFEFFGEALEGPAQAVHDAIEQLQWAAKRGAI